MVTVAWVSECVVFLFVYLCEWVSVECVGVMCIVVVWCDEMVWTALATSCDNSQSESDKVLWDSVLPKGLSQSYQMGRVRINPKKGRTDHTITERRERESWEEKTGSGTMFVCLCVCAVLYEKRRQMQRCRDAERTPALEGCLYSMTSTHSLSHFDHRPGIHPTTRRPSLYLSTRLNVSCYSPSHPW